MKKIIIYLLVVLLTSGALYGIFRLATTMRGGEGGGAPVADNASSKKAYLKSGTMIGTIISLENDIIKLEFGDSEGASDTEVFKITSSTKFTRRVEEGGKLLKETPMSGIFVGPVAQIRFPTSSVTAPYPALEIIITTPDTDKPTRP